ncbi:hypothetical protein Droror1_Dr00001853 [Drosera rotundifolia]
MKLGFPFPPNHVPLPLTPSPKPSISTSNPKIHSNPDPKSLLNSLITAAAKSRNLNHAAQIHAQIIVNRYVNFPVLITNLITLYAKCGRMDVSEGLFSRTDDRYKNVVTWTSRITQFARCGMVREAVEAFDGMRGKGIYPNEFSFSAVLPACRDWSGRQVHGLIEKHGFIGDVFVGSALVDMYAKCFDMGDAEKAFDEMPERNLVSWNSMIVGFLENGLYYKAVCYFRDVNGEELLCPDEVTYSSTLSACANMGCGLGIGRQVHGVVVKHGMSDLAYVANSLMDMHSKCGSFADGVDLFRTMVNKDVVTWNVMITGCVQNERFEEACKYFMAMRSEGVLLDEATLSTVLSACARISALNLGMSIHGEIFKAGFLTTTGLSGALITMYARAGSLVDAYRVFHDVEIRNVMNCTAMIAAFQLHGHSNKVIESFESMLQDGTNPDYITFVCLLSACGHTGRVSEGFAYFDSMATMYGIDPGPEHYACMVDMLGRAGRLEEAKTFIESMPMKADPSVWGALLGACRNHGNLELGRKVAERLFEIEPGNPGNYIILANMYSRRGKLKEGDEIRRFMGTKGVRKEPGCSWIDIKDTTFVFTVHDKSHSRTDEIYEMLRKLKELVEKRGYIAKTQYAVNDSKENKERSLWYHSERLALAFALLAVPPGAPIRIMKNLRTCGDCHTVMKFASEIFFREIIVRDINRFHHFANGSCSCGDYW